MNAGTGTLAVFSLMVLVCCRAADPTAVMAIKDWQKQVGVGFATVIDEADVVVAASVKNAKQCHSTWATTILKQTPAPAKLACATLRAIQVLRGDSSELDMEVLYLDAVAPTGGARLQRMPIGPTGSAGMYFLNRVGGRLWASLANDRSYISIDPQRYIRYTRDMSINEAIAANLLGSSSWSMSINVDAGEAVARVSAATQLAGLDRVGAMLERKTRSTEKPDAISACVLIMTRLGNHSDCAQRLRQAGGLLAEEESALVGAVPEAYREITRMIRMLDGHGPIVLEGLLNSAPGGACEVVRWQLNHNVESIRRRARDRVEDVCRDVGKQ